MPARFRLGPQRGRIAGAVGLAERVAARDERHGLFVVHRHAGEGLADVPHRGKRVRGAVRALGIDVNQTHLHGSERILEIPVAGVALVTQPRVLGTPVDVLFRLPDVLAPAGKTERLEPHRLERHVAGEDHEVSPGDLSAVLLLDRPEQPARPVEVDVIRPAVEGSKALVAGAGAAATVRDPVGAGAVPCHANEQRAVVAEVRGPPVLRIRHQGMEVFDNGIQVEPLEFLGVVEPRAHGVGLRRVLVQDVQLQLIGPPVCIRWGSSDHTLASSTRERALWFGGHGSLLWVACAQLLYATTLMDRWWMRE